MFHSKCFYLSILLHVLQPTRFNLSIYLSIYPSKIVSHTTRFYCLSIYVYFTQSVSMYLSILLRVFHSTYLGVLIYLSFYDCVSHSTRFYLSIHLRVFHSTCFYLSIHPSFYGYYTLPITLYAFQCIPLFAQLVAWRKRASECDPANWKKRQNRKFISKFDAGGGSCQQLPHAHHHTHWQIRVSRQVQDSKKLVIFSPVRSISSTQRWTWINR